MKESADFFTDCLFVLKSTQNGGIMKEKLEQIKAEAIREIQNSDGLAKLNDVRVAFLGKKGELTAVLKSMKDVLPEERPLVGQLVNETRQSIERLIEDTKARLEAAERDLKLKQEVIDVTLPAKKNLVGHSVLLPVLQHMQQLWKLFSASNVNPQSHPVLIYRL